MSPGLLESSEEKVWPSEEEDVRPWCVPLGQDSQVLVDHRLEQARYYLLDWDARLHEGVHVCLGEYTALGTHLVDLVAEVTHLREFVRRYAELSRTLLHEGARPSGAGALHEDLSRFLLTLSVEEYGLHVLTAYLGNEPHLRVERLHGGGDSNHLLDEPGTYELGDESCSRPRHVDPVPSWCETEPLLESLEELQNLLRLLRVVPLVAFVQYVPLFIYENVLARCRSYVKAEGKHITPSP